MVLKSCLFFRQLSIIEKKSRRFHIKIVKNDSNKNSPKTINYFFNPKHRNFKSYWASVYHTSCQQDYGGSKGQRNKSDMVSAKKIIPKFHVC